MKSSDWIIFLVGVVTGFVPSVVALMITKIRSPEVYESDSLASSQLDENLRLQRLILEQSKVWDKVDAWAESNMSKDPTVRIGDSKSEYILKKLKREGDKIIGPDCKKCRAPVLTKEFGFPKWANRPYEGERITYTFTDENGKQWAVDGDDIEIIHHDDGTATVKIFRI